MVREQQWRRAKYKAKIDGAVAEKRIDAYGKTMEQLHRSITSTLVLNEQMAKETILEPNGILTSEMPFYLNAMREFCKCCRDFTCGGDHVINCPTRDNKCFDIYCKYRDKGLIPRILIKLAGMCGCYPLGYGYYAEYDPPP